MSNRLKLATPRHGQGPARGTRAAKSDAELALQRGYPWLHFPWQLEQRYQAETAPTRLANLQTTGWVIILMTQLLILGDWWMVPDQLAFGATTRLLMVPAILWWMVRMPQWQPKLRERGLLFMSWALTAVLVAQVVRSQAPFAPAYLIHICALIMINGGMLRVRFWNALLIDLGQLAMYLAAVLLLPHAQTALMTSVLITVVATCVFTLWGAYRMEHSERSLWLRSQIDAHLQSRLHASIERFERLSKFDPLTSLPNRREALKRLNQMWTRASYDASPITVMLLDVDHFKRYNDHHGHAAGDACLQQVARALAAHLNGPGAFVARWGGEEFLAVLTGCASGEAQTRAQSALQAVRNLALPHGDSPSAAMVTASLGWATAIPGSGPPLPADLLQHADEALYRAKANGRNGASGGLWSAVPRSSVNASAKLDEAATPATAEPLRTETQRQTEVEREIDRLARPWCLPHFKRDLELRFWRARARTRLNDFLLTGLIAIVVFNLFLPVDYLLARDVWQQALTLRLAIYTPLWALVLGLSWRYKAVMLARVHPMVHEALVLCSGVMAGACLSYILAASRSPLVQYYHVGLMVVMLYGNLVQRLRFWSAVVSSTLIAGMHVHGALTAPQMDNRLVLPMITMLTFVGWFSLMANHAIDRDDRRGYLIGLHSKATLRHLDATEAQVRQLAHVDPLTGLFNRRHLDERLTALLNAGVHERSAQHGLAVVMVDVDHFKRYNDRYGHPEGDRCLTDVARALSSCLREPSDFAARTGGEEFLVVLGQTTPAGARLAAERIRLAVADLGRPHEDSPTSPVVTVSVGVAWTSPAVQIQSSAQDGHSAAPALMAQADAALYQAKHEGRNRVRWHMEANRTPPTSLSWDDDEQLSLTAAQTTCG